MIESRKQLCTMTLNHCPMQILTVIKTIQGEYYEIMCRQGDEYADNS